MEHSDAVPSLFSVEATCQPMKRVPPKISTRIEKILVQSVPDTILSATMNRKQCFWLLALVAAVLILNSCANQEGVAPAEGEMSRSHGGY
jgi:hypothetical protein